MPPIRFLLRCEQSSDRPGLAAAGPREERFPVIIRPLHDGCDLDAVAALAEQCRAIDPALAGRWSPAGLRTECVGREGRRVHGWLAWRAVQEPPAAESSAGPSGDRCPVGMVAVVDVGRRPLVRASIAWLLVHPAARRRGVATALVRRAVAEIGRRGGDVVSADTLSSWPAATAFWRRVAGDAERAPAGQGLSNA